MGSEKLTEMIDIVIPDHLSDLMNHKAVVFQEFHGFGDPICSKIAVKTLINALRENPAQICCINIKIPGHFGERQRERIINVDIFQNTGYHLFTIAPQAHTER